MLSSHVQTKIDGGPNLPSSLVYQSLPQMRAYNPCILFLLCVVQPIRLKSSRLLKKLSASELSPLLTCRDFQKVLDVFYFRYECFACRHV